MVKIEERPLSWVHGSLLSGGEQIFKEEVLCTCDVRLQIASTEPVKEGTQLHKEVLPVIDGHQILPISIKNGKPVISPVFAKKAKQIVTSVRRIELVEMFTNGSIDASVTYGDMYSGHDLVLNRPFCELALYFNAEKLSSCIREYVDEERLREVVSELFKTSITFQRILEEELPKH